MKKRVVQVRIVKENEAEEADVISVSGPHYEKVIDKISDEIERGLKIIGIAFVGYVIVDTARQLLVARATQQQQPKLILRQGV
jgi:hypothetical protein